MYKKKRDVVEEEAAGFFMNFKRVKSTLERVLSLVSKYSKLTKYLA